MDALETASSASAKPADAEREKLAVQAAAFSYNEDEEVAAEVARREKSIAASTRADAVAGAMHLFRAVKWPFGEIFLLLEAAANLVSRVVANRERCTLLLKRMQALKPSLVELQVMVQDVNRRCVLRLHAQKVRFTAPKVC